METTFQIARYSALKLALLLGVSLFALSACLGERFSLCQKKIFLLAVIFIDLWLFGHRYLVTFPVKECFFEKDVVSFFNSGPAQPYRIGSIPANYLNQGMVHQIASISGNDSNVSRRYQEFINFSQGRPSSYQHLDPNIEKYSPLLNLLNMKYLITYPNEDHPELKLVFQNKKLKIYKNEAALPRLFVVPEARVVSGRENIFHELANPGFSPRDYVLLEEEPRETAAELKNNGFISGESKAEIKEYTPNRVLVTAALARPGYLVLGDAYFPGWKAYVDGKEAKIYPAYYVLRAVSLKAGRHRIEFIYKPLSFRIGAYLSLVTSGILACLALKCLSNTKKCGQLFYPEVK